MLLRLAYLGVRNAFALLRLLPMSDRDKDAGILALRHQLRVLQQRPRTVRSIRALVLRLVRENPSWGYRRVHGELLVLGVKVAASTVWEILKDAGIDPAPERSTTIWAAFLRSRADALIACDFFETVTLSGTRLYVFAVIEHASRRIRVLGVAAQPTASWVTQAGRNLVMDPEDAGYRARFLIRDRDGKFPDLFDQFYNEHRPHQGIANASPLRPLPTPIADPGQITHLATRRRDRLGDILYEYEHAA